jgi:outer membrane protein assembly factor BamB
MARNLPIVLLVVAIGLAARADDWPMPGRDRTRNPVSPESGAPADWQVEARDPKTGAVERPARNVKWSAKLGSRSLGGPVVAGGLVWVGTNNGSPRDQRDTVAGKDGRRQPIDMSVLMCFRESDGKFLWQYASRRLETGLINDGYGHSMGVALVEGDRLWLYTNRCEVLSLDISPLRRGEGPPEEVWRVDLRQRFGVFPNAPLMAAGYSPSPAADAERVFAVTTNGMDESLRNVPAPAAPSLVALAKATGRVLWTDASPGKDILHSQLSSPLVVPVGGRTQVIVGQGDGWLRAFQAETGRLIWKCDLNPKGAKDGLGGHGRRNYVMATPVFHDGRVYIAPGQDPEHFAGENELFCIDPTGTGDVSAELDDGAGKGRANPNARVVWRYGGPAPKGHDRDYLFGRTLGSCAVHDGLVYACDIEGFAFCIDAKSGRLHWRHDLRASSRCGPLWADGKVYFTTEDGDVWVFAHGREKKLLATVAMDRPIYAAPVFANSTLYVMTEPYLFAIQAPK